MPLAVETLDKPPVDEAMRSLGDGGKRICPLCTLTPGSVPGTVHVAEDTRPISGNADIIGVAGAGKVDIGEADLKYKQKTTGKLSKIPAAFLRFLVGEGNMKQTPDGLGKAG